MNLLKSTKKNNSNNPLSLLVLDLDDHNYSHCQDEYCAECNHMADEILNQYKVSNNTRGRIRLTKFQVQRLRNFFGERITKKAISRFNQSEIYKRKHYNIIPCSCDNKSHNKCDGMTWDKQITSISHSCKCKRHSRIEKKEFRKFEEVLWL